MRLGKLIFFYADIDEWNPYFRDTECRAKRLAEKDLQDLHYGVVCSSAGESGSPG